MTHIHLETDTYQSGYDDACNDMKKYIQGWLELSSGNLDKYPWLDVLQICFYETYRKICDLQGKPRTPKLLQR